MTAWTYSFTVSLVKASVQVCTLYVSLARDHINDSVRLGGTFSDPSKSGQGLCIRHVLQNTNLALYTTVGSPRLTRVSFVKSLWRTSYCESYSSLQLATIMKHIHCFQPMKMVQPVTFAGHTQLFSHSHSHCQGTDWGSWLAKADSELI